MKYTTPPFLLVHAEGDLLPGAYGKGTLPDPPPQGVHLTPTAQRGQSPDLIPLASTDQNQVHPREGQGISPLPGEGQCLHPLRGDQCLLGRGRSLVVQDTAVVAHISPGHNLTGEAHTVHVAGLEILKCVNVYVIVLFTNYFTEHKNQ